MKKFLLMPLAVLALAAGTTASAASERAVTDRFLVGFDGTPRAAERALVARHGGEVTRDFSEIGALAVRISEHGAGSLAREGNVRYVERDEKRYALGLSTSQLTPSLSNGLYGLITTNSDDVHAGVAPLSRSYTGSGINACVADTAIDYTHPDIATNYKGGTDTVNNDADPAYNDADDPTIDPANVETHGTHVAGTVLGVNNSVGVYGVAYNANLYYARVLGPNGGYSSDIMDGVRWLVETAKCKVVNMSLGGSFKSRTEENFYKSMRSKGALIVAATGNDSATRISYPAGYAANIAVGAVDRNNAHADFSNIGKNIDISGPGVTVLSAVPDEHGSEASVSSGSNYIAYGMEYAGKTSGTTDTLVDCGLAKAPSDCVNKPADGSFVALIQRGEISFADKVTNAKQAGAVAAVIYNNATSEFIGTLGSAGSWIPTVSMSGTDGSSLKSTRLGQDATVVNIVSDWDHYDGTSMATPHVTGVIALIWSYNSALSNLTVEDHLFKTATDLGAAGYDTTYGYGLANALAAVDRAGG